MSRLSCEVRTDSGQAVRLQIPPREECKFPELLLLFIRCLSSNFNDEVMVRMIVINVVGE